MFCFIQGSFLLKLTSLLPKPVLITSLACFNLAVKLSAVSLLNLGVMIYLALSIFLFSTSLIFVVVLVVVKQL